jgi:MFS family permease
MTRALVVDLVPAHLRATALGGYTFAIGLAALPASLVAGLLWDTVSPSAPFVFSAILMSAAAIALATTRFAPIPSAPSVQESPL